MSRDTSCPGLDLFPMGFICMSASSKPHSYHTHTSAPYDGLAGQTQQASVLQWLQLDLSAVIMSWVHSTCSRLGESSSPCAGHVHSIHSLSKAGLLMVVVNFYFWPFQLYPLLEDKFLDRHCTMRHALTVHHLTTPIRRQRSHKCKNLLFPLWSLGLKLGWYSGEYSFMTWCFHPIKKKLPGTFKEHFFQIIMKLHLLIYANNNWETAKKNEKIGKVQLKDIFFNVNQQMPGCFVKKEFRHCRKPIPLVPCSISLNSVSWRWREIKNLQEKQNK